jgi:two-component system OmpR family response regulator
MVSQSRNCGAKIKTPVLLLTCNHRDKVRPQSADDYLTKPFAFQLLARVRALRGAKSIPTAVIRVADLSDPVRQTRGRRIELSPRVCLSIFHEKCEQGPPGTVIDHVWNYDFDNETNVVDVTSTFER